MGKKLIIAEKPSVASDIAKALGGFKKQGDYYESDQYVLSSAVGHLLELTAPEEYEAKRGKWSFAHLPVIPPHFELRPIEKTADRLKLLLKLIRRKDVVGLINACDAGREGELIFRSIVQYSQTKKPIERLWLQSMTPEAIREGFAQLKKDQELRPLADAAVSRSEADWLVGINGTRAMTAFNSKDGGFYKTTVGRVQTPTLRILVEREEQIRSFVPRDYWEVHATFAAEAGEYLGRWFDETAQKQRGDRDPEAKPERLWDEAAARALQAKCQGKPGSVSEETKPSSQAAPLLFDLTSLQREANSRFGFSARTTLALAQALYEKHKVLTYPRTDSRALPEDYLSTVKKTLDTLRGGMKSGGPAAPFAPFAQEILKQGWVKPNKRIFNNEKVSDHFAIIPTLQLPKSLNEAEQKLYELVVRRFLAIFYPPAEYLVTTRITRVTGEPFKTEGRVLLNPGWLAVYGKEAAAEDAQSLAPVKPGEKPLAREVEVRANQTKPPARYTEATLLSAMEGAGKLIEDEELRAAMAARGLGTPATRAQIIEGLIQEEYVLRNGRELQPTAKAFSLLFALDHFGVKELTSPELTGQWEFNLKQMEQGKLPRSRFMDHIVDLTRDMVKRIKEGALPDEAFRTLKSPCPRCGGVVQENYRKFQCQRCDFSLWKVVSGRALEPQEAEALIAEGRVGPLVGFRSRLGRPFSATLRLAEGFRVEFDFGQSAAEANEEDVSFSGQEPLGSCPKCGARVYEQGAAYVCENAAGRNRGCDFRASKVILQRPLEPEQMKKLLTAGRTDLLHRFVSRKNGRTFSAHLVLKQGNIGFEFAAKGSSKKAASKETAPPSASRRKKAATS